MNTKVICTMAVSLLTTASIAEDIARRAELPGELTVEQILNGEYPWPASPDVDTSKVDDPDFRADAFGEVPAPGVHPRILISPEDLPRIRKSITDTMAGRFAYHQITYNQEKSIRKGGTFSHEILERTVPEDVYTDPETRSELFELKHARSREKSESILPQNKRGDTL